MSLRRTLADVIRASDRSRPLLLAGPRRSGKTALLAACAEGGRTRVSLDDLETRSAAQADPRAFLASFRPPLWLDDVQFAPGIAAGAAALAAQTGHGDLWLSGSHPLGLGSPADPGVTRLHLDGLSQAERQGRPDRPPFLPADRETLERRAADAGTAPDALFHAMWLGSMPAMAGAGDDGWAAFHTAWVHDVIERDMRVLGRVESETRFLRFMKALAARTGGMLNCSDLARDVGVSAPTIKAWVAMLETSGVVHLLPSLPCAAGRAIRTPKVYFMDTGLVCFLNGWTSPQEVRTGFRDGMLLETWVVSELVKSRRSRGLAPGLFCWRDKDGREIELLLEHDGALHPMAVRRREVPDSADTRHFGLVDRLFGRRRGHGAVICLCRGAVPVGDGVTAVPAACI